MQVTRELAPDIHWVGVNDRRLERFEHMFPLPAGVAYNAYMILDEKTVLLDTVDSSVRDRFIENVRHVLAGRTLDYLVINHMEPDHCGNIEEIVRMYPQVKVVGNRKTFEFFERYYPLDIKAQALVVKDGDTLSTGKHELQFHLAPMVHWPEVMFTLDSYDGTLYSADAFGAFGAHPGTLFADEVDFNGFFRDEMRRYYANIVGRYGSQVQAVLKRLPLDRVAMICPLHGPIWHKELDHVLELHKQWSSYRPEQVGVVFAYASMYGNTEHAVDSLANKLACRGVTDMRLHDVSTTHPSYIISDIFKYSHLVVAAPTYNMQLYPPMDSLLREMAMLNVQDRAVAVLGNHTWSSAAIKQITGLLGTMKGMRMIGMPLDIHSSVKADQEEQLDALADAIELSLLQEG